VTVSAEQTPTATPTTTDPKDPDAPGFGPVVTIAAVITLGITAWYRSRHQ